MALRLTASSFVPLLTFCMLRWLIVGQFSLVAFGGYNLVGVAGQFLTEERVGQLPEELQAVAHEGVQRKQQFIETNDLWATGESLTYMVMEERYDSTIWDIYVPVAEAEYGKNNKAMNSALRQLASSVIQVYPKSYCIWLIKAFRRGVQMMASEFVANPINLFILGRTIFVHGFSVVRRRQREVQTTTTAQAPCLLGFNLLAVALFFSMAKLLMVILVVPPLGRFTDAAAVFFPVVAAAGLMCRIEAVFGRSPRK